LRGNWRLMVNDNRNVFGIGLRSSRRAGGGLLRLDVHARTGRAHVGYLRTHLRRAHALLGPALREMSLALVGDRRMAELHERFMGVAGTTDVLTFELDHDARGRVVAGEVVVCVPYAIRQAKRTGISVRNELLLYALHGMLHLCGFDDRTDRDFAVMHQREDDILSRLGIGPVFAPARVNAGGPRNPKKGRRRTGR